MGLRAEIASSWRRTASAGLDPGARVDPEDVADYDPASRLRRAAGPVLDAVAEHLVGTRYGVVLADRDSCIVDARFGRAELQTRLAALGAVPGKTFTEATTGTNSVATAGETHRGVAVHGEEHYLEAFKRFACFGAPIRDPLTRRHAGVLGITCFAEDAAPLLRPFLLRAVDDIETSLLENAQSSHRRVLAAFEAARPRAGALVAFGPDLVLTNDAAANMLGPSDHTTLQMLCSDTSSDGRRSVELASERRPPSRSSASTDTWSVSLHRPVRHPSLGGPRAHGSRRTSIGTRTSPPRSRPTDPPAPRSSFTASRAPAGRRRPGASPGTESWRRSSAPASAPRASRTSCPSSSTSRPSCAPWWSTTPTSSRSTSKRSSLASSTPTPYVLSPPSELRRPAARRRSLPAVRFASS